MKAVVLFSGGIDSTTLLYHLLRYKYDVHALSIGYGQSHERREIDAAKRIAELHNNMRWDHIQINGWKDLLPNNQLTGDRESLSPVVPNRNMVFLSVATSVAMAQDANIVAFAPHADDYEVFPDCRVIFIKALQSAINTSNPDNNILLHTPFIYWNKFRIIERAIELDVPLGLTWSCYRNGTIHCGVCSACTGRLEAFKLAGIVDPTEYME